MKKLCLGVFVGILMAVFTLSNAAFAQLGYNGKHYNLNVIGFAQCTKDTTTDPNCFKGNAGDIQTSGHTIFVPLRTTLVENICDPGTTAPSTEMFTAAWLQKGVRILVADGEDLQVTDRDATDGTARLTLPDGKYVIMARALGKPDGCMDVDTVLCYDETFEGSGVYVQVNCSADLNNDKYVVVGHLDVDRAKGKPVWKNATGDLLPAATGVGIGDPGYFDFFWQIFNDNLRLLQLRIYYVGPADA